jgi:putative component of toxin-antitoxin plasmid stabilization module
MRSIEHTSRVPGQGLYELRVRHTAEEIERMFGDAEAVSEEDPVQGRGEILLRVYFMTEGRKLVLLLAGYDKGRFGSGKREDRVIAQARQRVAVQKRRARRAKAERRKGR